MSENVLILVNLIGLTVFSLVGLGVYCLVSDLYWERSHLKHISTVVPLEEWRKKEPYEFLQRYIDQVLMLIKER